MNSSRIVVIGGLPESLINFRGDLIKALRPKFKYLTAMSARAPKPVIDKLQEMGVDHQSLSLQRNGLNPLRDIQLLFQMIRRLRRLNPSVVFAYTIKPVVWGGVASRVTGVPFVALITGLGYAFQGDSLVRKALTKVTITLYKIALLRARCVVFQNPDNAHLFVRLGIVPLERTLVVNGSGVNMSLFREMPFPLFKTGCLHFLCVARLLREKGLLEYAEAAAIVKKRYPESRFSLVGPIDPSPDAVPVEQVRGWQNIEYLGETSDVRPYIEASHVYVLPSYHEGLPRSTLEAMSMGRPVITTNAVGCKETVIDGWNGYKVDVADANQLAEKMIWCIENQDKLEQMGKNSRSLVEERFDVRVVNAEIMKALGVAS